MFVAPVVVHLSRLVTDRGKPPETADGADGEASKAAGEGEDTKVRRERKVPLYGLRLMSSKDDIIAAETTSSKEKKTPPRKAIRIRRVRQTKAKAKRRESKPASPSTGTSVKC
jgi:hypothetical protein